LFLKQNSKQYIAAIRGVGWKERITNPHGRGPAQGKKKWETTWNLAFRNESGTKKTGVRHY